MTWSDNERKFATIFRREASRTKAAMSGRDDVVTLARAATTTMDGYDEWAAVAVGRFCSRHGWPSTTALASLASSLCRSPMCEVAWVEIALGDGAQPDQDAYDALAARHPGVRRFPRLVGSTDYRLVELYRRLPVANSLGMMLADQPWLVPKDVWDDPVYRGAIPTATMLHDDLRWDPEGLRKRVVHEMELLHWSGRLAQQR